MDGAGQLTSHFTDDTRDRAIDLENNILAIKRIGKKNTLNLSATYNYFRNKGNEDFVADSVFYNGYRDLDDSYGYANRMRSQYGGAEAFVLLRLNDNYYTRLGLSSYVDQEDLLTDLTQQTLTTAFDNDDYIRHYDNAVDLQLRKDRGKLQFAAKAKLSYLKFETDVSRTLTRMDRLVVTPSVDVKYSFNNYHALSLNYKDAVNTYGIRNLFSHLVIDDYRMLHSSSVGSTFGYYHTTSLIQQFMRPISGFTLINAVAFTYSADDVLNDNLLNSIVREADYKISSSGTNTLTVTSYVDKKFRSFPLDLTASLSYNHGYSPYYMAGTIVRSKSNNYVAFGSASTFRKKGMNFKATASYSVMEMRGGGSRYSVKSGNYLAQLSYIFPKLYVEVKSRYRVVRLEESEFANVPMDKPQSITIMGQTIDGKTLEEQYKGNISYKNRKKNVSIQRVNFMGKVILVKDGLDADTFDVVGGEKKEILGYECKKAVSRDKKQTVWFTDYIPVADGPMVGQGITGLVLEASDENNLYLATKISDTVSGTFTEPTDGQVMSMKEFKDYVKKTTDMLKMGSGL